MASSWSVTLAMALTTTTGFCACRPFTIAAARSIALASSTEVPPNFITIIGDTFFAADRRRATQMKCHIRIFGRCHPQRTQRSSIEISLDLEQLGVEQDRAGRPADRVVGKHGELPVQHAAGTQAAHRGRHSVAAVGIEPRLRAVYCS